MIIAAHCSNDLFCVCVCLSADFPDDYIYLSQGEQLVHATSTLTAVDMKSVTSGCLHDIADQGYPTPAVYAAGSSPAEPSSNQVTPPLLVQRCGYTPGA